MVLRTDLLGRADGVEPTPSGGVRVPANLTRVGVFTYHNHDGTSVRELRHPDDVFEQASLDSLADAPVTVGHPGTVTPETWRTDAVGHVRDVKQDGRYVAAKVIVADAAAVKGIKDKTLVELSCGYSCDLVDTKGEYQGETFDARQTNIRYNHVAMGPKDWGRAGNEVKLKLDSAYSDYVAPIEPASSPIMTVNVNDASELAAVRADRDTARAERDAAKVDLVTLQGRLDAVTAERDALKADASPTKVDALVQARVAVLDGARKVLGKADASKSDAELIGAVLLKHDAKFDSKDKSPEYLRARFDFVVGGYQATQGQLNELRSGVIGRVDGAVTTDEDVQKKLDAFKAKNAAAWENKK